MLFSLVMKSLSQLFTAFDGLFMYLSAGVGLYFLLHYLFVTDWDKKLFIAARDGDLDSAKVALKNGANPDCTFNDDYTAMLIASENGHLRLVQFLLRHCHNIEDANDAGNTALLLASRFGHVDVVEALLKFRADIKAIDLNGNSALIFAVGNDLFYFSFLK